MLGVPITQAMASLLRAILEQTSANKVLHLCLPHYRQFGSFVTKISDTYREVLQIRDPKLIQGQIDNLPREKSLQAMAEEKVSPGQLAIRNGAIAEANSQAVDLVTFNAKADIKAALSLVKDANTASGGATGPYCEESAYTALQGPTITQQCLGALPDSLSGYHWY